MTKKIKYFLGGIGLIVIAGVIIIIMLLGPVSKEQTVITFSVPSGASKIDIVSNLKKAGLIQSKYASLIYVFFNRDLNLQAGNYNLQKDMSTKEIFNYIAAGKTNEVVPTVYITFVEGKKLTDYAKQIAANFDITYDDFIERTSDKEFLKELVDHYDFLDESILDEKLYYPLDGYLAADTYEFYQNSDVDTIVYRMLNNMQARYNKLQKQIEESKYSFHDLLTMASIIEKEGNSSKDRKIISQVIYKRLDINMSLGMDVTTYYGVKKDLSEEITQDDLNDDNPYNTRNNNFKGLPIGPICSPSLDSITAALEPSDTDYVYFAADVDTGAVYFAKNDEEWIELLRQLGLR